MRFTARDTVRALATVVFVCFSFTAVASAVLMLYTRRHPELDAIQLPGGLLLRAILFSLLAAGAGATLWRLRGSSPCIVQGSAPPAASPRTGRALLLLLAAIALLLGWRIGQYPWAAPDEVHHLVVARNLAVHGAYASGHPETGFNHFDSFDSVGPAVIVPIALAFKIFGVHLEVARLVIVAFFLGLCIAMYRFTQGLFGAWTGLLAVLVLTGTYSSIYLGRTVYGEVPSLMFLLFGMLAWRRALVSSTYSSDKPYPSYPSRLSSRNPVIAWGLLAGALLAFAVLAKTIVALLAFSLVGVWLYDRATRRTIRWPHVLFPILGGVAVLAAWPLFQRLHAPEVAGQGSVLDIYQHYLLFGVSSFPNAFRNAVLPHPLAHLAWLGVIVASIPVLFRDRHDPPAIALFLHAVFMLYWWFFFTPGQLHRYLWNGYVILSFLVSFYIFIAVCILFSSETTTRWRVGSFGAMLLLVLPGTQWILLQTYEIAIKTEMHRDRALVQTLATMPFNTRIATDVERLPGVVNFFGNRAISAGENPIELLRNFDLVITHDSPDLRAALPPGCRVKTAGDFVLLSTAQPAE